MPGTISLNVNIDGLPIYNSSKLQLWPILCHVFEIPRSPVIVAGIYAGQNKPSDLNGYLLPFVTEMKQLESGITVTDKSGKEKTIQVKLRAFLCDSPARALIKGKHDLSKNHNLSSQMTVNLDYDRPIYFVF